MQLLQENVKIQIFHNAKGKLYLINNKILDIRYRILNTTDCNFKNDSNRGKAVNLPDFHS